MSDLSENTQSIVIPDGYRRNASGHLVPEHMIRPHDLLRDQVVRDLVQEAKRIEEWLRAFREKALADIADVAQVAADQYGVKLGGKKGNIQLISYDGQYKVVRAVSAKVKLDEHIHAAKELIDACIRRWSAGADKNIQILVDRAFRTDTEGNIRTQAVMELLSIEIDDHQWKEAMDAVKRSIFTAGTAIYVRVYERIGTADKYQPIALDLGSA